MFLLGFPMSLIGALSLSTARLIREEDAVGERLQKLMFRQRTITQAIGMISIFVTALWGMYQNLTYGVLG